MSVELVGVVVNDIGLPILPVGNPTGRKAFFTIFLTETETGRKLQPYLTPEAQQRIGEVCERWYGPDAEITIEKLERVVASLLAVRDPAVVPAEPEPVAVVERPRNAQGQFLSEFETWANDPQRSMAEIRQRADNDPDFRAWFRETAVAQTYQPGSMRVLGQPTREATETDRQVLGDFVCGYNSTPAARLKPLNGVITIGDRKYTKAQFDGLVERACTAGLL